MSKKLNSDSISKVVEKLHEVRAACLMTSDGTVAPDDIDLSLPELKVAWWLIVQQDVNIRLDTGGASLCMAKMLELALLSIELSVENESMDFICYEPFLKIKNDFLNSLQLNRNDKINN